MPSAQVVQQQQSNSNKIAKAAAKVAEQRKNSINTLQQQHTEQQHQQQSSSGGSTGQKTPQDQPEFIKQSLTIIEKKVRNLEKRRQKLDEYKASQRKGTQLNEDQLNAVERYDEVTRTLEMARELEKQFITLANDTMRLHKKQLKREQLEREEHLKDRFRDLQRFQWLLQQTNQFDDFVTNGLLNQNELNQLSEFARLVVSNVEQQQQQQFDSCSEVADHLHSLVEGKNKSIQQTTYAELKRLLERLLQSQFWNKSTQQQQNEVEQVEQQHQQQQVVESEQQQQQQYVEQQHEQLTESVNNLNLNTEQQQQQSEDHQQLHQQGTFFFKLKINVP
jgi:caprin-1